MPLRARQRILAVSRDPKLADVRKATLESAGFSVIQATDDSAVEQACSNGGLKLIMLGYSLPPSDKRRVWAASRRCCNVPIIELHRRGKPELVEQHVLAHESQTPNDFLEAVQKLLYRPNNRH